MEQAKINELKAKAYDIVAAMQSMQQQLIQVNQEIQKEMGL